MMRGKHFTSYDIIGRDALELIEFENPNLLTPAVCQAICQLVNRCEYFTVDTDDHGCYLVDSAAALEYSDDKISGPKSCEIK